MQPQLKPKLAFNNLQVLALTGANYYLSQIIIRYRYMQPQTINLLNLRMTLLVVNTSFIYFVYFSLLKVIYRFICAKWDILF